MGAPLAQMDSQQSQKVRDIKNGAPGGIILCAQPAGRRKPHCLASLGSNPDQQDYRSVARHWVIGTDVCHVLWIQ